MLGDHIGSMAGASQMKALPAVNGMASAETTATTAGTLAGVEAVSYTHLRAHET